MKTQWLYTHDGIVEVSTLKIGIRRSIVNGPNTRYGVANDKFKFNYFADNASLFDSKEEATKEMLRSTAEAQASLPRKGDFVGYFVEGSTIKTTTGIVTRLTDCFYYIQNTHGGKPHRRKKETIIILSRAKK